MTTPPSHPIRVLLVDDHAMVRKGLATFLMVFDDMEMAGEASNGSDALQVCEQVNPDVVLMDLIMPEMDGVAATRAIRKQFPAVQVLALTSFKDEDLVKNALQAGAIGYLLKDVTADELAEAIRAAHTGHTTISPEVGRALAHAASQPPTPGYDLTEREREVLAFLVEGLNNKQIAEKLYVSPSTIKSHVSNILSKLEVASRTEAATLALRHRIIL